MKREEITNWSKVLSHFLSKVYSNPRSNIFFFNISLLSKQGFLLKQKKRNGRK